MEKARFYASTRSDRVGPLQGLRVLEATTTWAGPMGGCLLADFGADVIKVEPPAGDVARRLPPFLPGTSGLSFMHQTVNRNKRSLTLDLRRPEGRDVFLELATRTDVVVENFRPGTMDRFGVGYAAVSSRKPDIVYVSVSGFGQFGPLSDRVGYDPLAQATSGWLAMNGSPDAPPVKAPTFIADDFAGLHTALSALAALRHRDATGEGQHVDISLLDVLLFQSNGYLTLAAMGAPPERIGNAFQVAAPANAYPCRDGTVVAGVLLDAHWRLLAELIGRPELAEHPDYATTPARLERRAEVDRLLGDWIAERSREEVIELFSRAGLPAAPVRTYAESASDPHVIERDMLQPTLLEDGSVAPITGPAAKFSRTPVRVRTGAPALGSHTDEILAEIGLDAGARGHLRESGVI